MLYLYQKEERKVRTMNAYIIIAIDNNGTKTAIDMEFATWENACTMQEILETACEDFGFLIYTADEWVHECEMSA